MYIFAFFFEIRMMSFGRYTQGIVYAVIAYVSWGLLPLYWKLLDEIVSVNILAHRILWSSVFTLVFCLFFKRDYLRKYFTETKSLVNLAITGVLVSTNWGVYIYAVNSGQIVEASLGYFINPLFCIVLGMIFLGEKLNKIQIVAFMLAIAGVSYLTFNYGRIPWIALVLATSFGVYGLMKKKMNYDSMSALAVETTLIAPIALGYLVFGVSDGATAFTTLPLSIIVLLVFSGIVTALPLYWFGMAAVKLPLYSIGFFQYIAPSIKLFIGLYLFNEKFSLTHTITFTLIWTGLALYIVDIILKQKNQK